MSDAEKSKSKRLSGDVGDCGFERLRNRLFRACPSFSLSVCCLLAAGAFFCLTGCAADVPATSVMPLWPNGAPGDNGLSGPERGKNCISNVSKPILQVYLPEAVKATGAAVVVIPGGGYGSVCMASEGHNIAQILLKRGIAAVVLKYRLPNGNHEIPGMDARRAIRTVRHRASEWKIDKNRVGVWGFSAGGHLASTVSTVFDAGDAEADDPVEKQSSRPDASILFYPVISMKPGITHNGSRRNLIGAGSPELVKRYSNEDQITKDTPPTLLLHAKDDGAVPLKNTLLYDQALKDNGVPATKLIYEKGNHGPGAFRKNSEWEDAFDIWLKERDFIK